MSFREEYYNDNKTLRLTGSQINFTSRSDQTVSGSSCNRKLRPCSANLCHGNQIGKACKLRPKSAEYERQSFRCPPSNGQHKCFGGSSLALSYFTESSSKFLQNLLHTSNGTSIPALEDRSFDIDKLSQMSGRSMTECSVEDRKSEAENNVEYLTGEHLSLDSELQNGITLQVNPNLERVKVKTSHPEVAEEKSVRFYEGQVNIFAENHSCCRNSESLYSCLKNNFKFHFEEPFQSLKKTSSEPEVSQLDTQRTIVLNDQSESAKIESDRSNKLKTLNFDNLEGVSKSKEGDEVEIRHNISPKETCNKSLLGTTETLRSELHLLPPQQISEFNNSHIRDTPVGNFDNPRDISSVQEIHKELENHNTANKEGLKCDNNQKIDSTYEEIVCLLQALEEEDDCDSVNLGTKRESDAENSPEMISAEEQVDYFGAVSSYLEEVEKDDGNLQENHNTVEKWDFTSPRLEDLLNKNSVELAHEVFSLKIQIEDQKKGIKLLKDTLAEQKEAKKILELEHQEALHKARSEAETLVQRHQKFIKQLLNEKKNLNETVSKLVQDLKSGEDRYKRNIKAMEEKHLVEIKRAKETQAAADKIKREKWMETKTQKIKEMTVKGLEPELSRMALRQQEEMTELRNLQKAELEAVELRAARRTSELMDELRAELTKEKERAIAKEISNLRTSMEKDFEEERNKLQQYCQSLKDRNKKQEEKFSNQEYEFQQRLLDFRQEEEKKKQKIIREHQEDLEESRRQHLVELKNLKEALEAEKEIFINNYKKQQASKLLEREAELHQQYKKERDREIELIIETLEKESSQIQAELNTACEGKLKRLKDKMEAEIKEIETSEEALKIKLSDTKSKLSEKEDCITELKSQVRQLQTELTFCKKSCEEMSSEKARLREVVRGEFETTINGLNKEKENLEKEIQVIKDLHSKELAKKDQMNIQAKCEMQKELTRVYSRIKTAVNKKEKIIESLREENGATNQRCRQLEYMLDQQRRNLLLQ